MGQVNKSFDEEGKEFLSFRQMTAGVEKGSVGRSISERVAEEKAARQRLGPTTMAKTQMKRMLDPTLPGREDIELHMLTHLP